MGVLHDRLNATVFPIGLFSVSLHASEGYWLPIVACTTGSGVIGTSCTHKDTTSRFRLKSDMLHFNWWNELTSSWSQTEYAQRDAEQSGRQGDGASGSHVDNAVNQRRTDPKCNPHRCIYTCCTTRVFFNLWFLNWGQEVHYCIMALRAAHLALR